MYGLVTEIVHYYYQPVYHTYYRMQRSLSNAAWKPFGALQRSCYDSSPSVDGFPSKSNPAPSLHLCIFNRDPRPRREDEKADQRELVNGI